MTPDDLFAAFAELDGHLAAYRDSAALARVAAALPTAQAPYVAATAVFLEELPPDWGRSNYPPERFHRFEGILRELGFQDGRTFEAQLYLAFWAFRQPLNGNVGINMLASLSSLLRKMPLDLSYAKPLYRLFLLLRTNEDLEHNAQVCCNALRRRFPELAEGNP